MYPDLWNEMYMRTKLLNRHLIKSGIADWQFEMKPAAHRWEFKDDADWKDQEYFKIKVRKYYLFAPSESLNVKKSAVIMDGY